VRTQTELGRRLTLSAVAVSRILDEYKLRERVPVLGLSMSPVVRDLASRIFHRGLRGNTIERVGQRETASPVRRIPRLRCGEKGCALSFHRVELRRTTVSVANTLWEPSAPDANVASCRRAESSSPVSHPPRSFVTCCVAMRAMRAPVLRHLMDACLGPQQFELLSRRLLSRGAESPKCEQAGCDGDELRGHELLHGRLKGVGRMIEVPVRRGLPVQ